MIQLLEVYVRKIEFKCIRDIIITNQNLAMKSDININSKFNRREKILSVILEISGSGQTTNNVIPLNFSVEIEGIFKVSTTSNLNESALDILSKVKAPQLLFPFILENLQSLTSKAGIKPLILPYIDFEKIYFENRKINEEKIIN